MKLYVFGAGGHAREVAQIARDSAASELQIEFVEDDRYFLSRYVGASRVVSLSSIPTGEGPRYVVAIGDPQVRKRAAAALESTGARPIALRHPSAVISPNARLAPGSIVFPQCVISDEVEIGWHTHINSGSTISHDVKLGDFVTVSPGVHIAGRVMVQDFVVLGIGSSVVNGDPGEPLAIGQGARVGAGACVLRSVGELDTVVGVPAKSMRP